MLTGETIAKPLARCGAIPMSSWLVVWMLTYSGCSPENRETYTRVPIEGTVTLDQVPLDEAMIRFIPTGQTPGPKTMFPIREGKFAATVDSAPAAGRHRVEIQWVTAGEFAHDDEQALLRPRLTPRVIGSPPKLPEKYHNKSVLTAELLPTADGSPQTLEFSLSSSGR